MDMVAAWLCGRVVKAQRYESARVKRRGFESRTCRNHLPQANSQLSCPSFRRSVNEYSIKFEELQYGCKAFRSYMIDDWLK